MTCPGRTVSQEQNQVQAPNSMIRTSMLLPHSVKPPHLGKAGCGIKTPLILSSSRKTVGKEGGRNLVLVYISTSLLTLFNFPHFFVFHIFIFPIEYMRSSVLEVPSGANVCSLLLVEYGGSPRMAPDSKEHLPSPALASR